jgi:hypothetical protein
MLFKLLRAALSIESSLPAAQPREHRSSFLRVALV